MRRYLAWFRGVNHESHLAMECEIARSEPAPCARHVNMFGATFVLIRMRRAYARSARLVVYRRTVGAAALVVLPMLAIGGQSTSATGTVSDSVTGRPLAGAFLQVSDTQRTFSARTDDAGVFILHAVAGQYRILVRRIGYAPLILSAALPTTAMMDLRLAPIPQALRAVRVTAGGAGIYGEIGALADLSRIKGAKVQIAGANATLQTDSAGSFFVPLKHPGTYAIRVTADGYAMDLFTVTVSENEVADASRYLLRVEKSGSIPEMAWNQFDQRLRWAERQNYVFVPGSDIRLYNGSVRDAVQALGSRVGNGAQLGDFPPCIFLDGVARPGMSLEQIRIEEVKAIEIYGMDPWRPLEYEKEEYKFFHRAWSGPEPCLKKYIKNGSGKVIIAYVSIWTK
jgi:hypothetical protein